MDMNQAVIKGGWLQVKGQLRESWGFLVKDGEEVVLGRREQFNGRVLARKGLREGALDREQRASAGAERKVEILAKRIKGQTERPRG